MNSIILLLETIMLLVIVNLIVWSLNDAQNMKNEIQRLNESQEIYGLIDFTTRMRQEELFQNDSSIPRLKKLYDLIYENDQVKAFPLYSSNIEFQKSSFGNSGFLSTSETNVSIPFLYANDRFFEYFNISPAEGKSFDSTDYEKNSDIVPILIGSDLTFKFKIGDILEPIGGLRYQVVGVLHEGSSYIDIMASRDFKNLDKMIILPFNKNLFVSPIDHSAIISRAYLTVDDPSALSEILQRSAETDTLSFAFKSMLHQSKFVAQDKEKMLQLQLLLSSLILIFTFITVTVSYLQFIEKHIYEFGVHILSGATPKDLMIRLGGQFALLLILSNLLVPNLLRAFANLSVSVAASALLCVVFLILPMLRLGRMPMTSMLKGRSR
ncbi:ABC transporter permease [Saccharibacillus sacchari]|uniref:ABC transporter permease n=1 Tax=Saccharibacillus sacchari TaxID=456493 RepID=UPI0030EB99F4